MLASWHVMSDTTLYQTGVTYVSEYFPKKAIALTMILGLGLTACSSEGKKDPPAKPHNSKPAPTVPNVQVKYFANGSRELVMTAINKSGAIDGKEGIDVYGFSAVTDIFQFCDGPDLVEETEGFTENDGNTIANGLARSVSFPGCADGRLTPSDFLPLGSAETK